MKKILTILALALAGIPCPAMMFFGGSTSDADHADNIDNATGSGVNLSGIFNGTGTIQGTYYYQNGGMLADENGQLHYITGQPITGLLGELYTQHGMLADANGQIMWPSGKVFADTIGNLFYANGDMLASQSEALYYAGGAILTDPNGNLYYYNQNQLADANGNLYGNGANLTGLSAAQIAGLPTTNGLAVNTLEGVLMVTTTNALLNLAGATNAAQFSQTATLNGNLYFIQPTNLAPGFSGTIYLSQSGVLTNTVNFDTNYWQPQIAGQILTMPTNSSSSAQIISWYAVKTNAVKFAQTLFP